MAQHDTDCQPDHAISAPRRWCARASWIVATDVLAARVHAHALAHCIGVSAVFSVETARDMDCAAMLDFLATDPHTDSVFVVMSRIESPARFLSAARACTRFKPVFAWCETPDDTDAQTYAAALDRTGFVLADSVDQLLDWCEVAEKSGLRTGPLIERHRATMARLMATPPLPAEDARGLRRAHTCVRERLDDLSARATDEHVWIDAHQAQALLRDFGLRSSVEAVRGTIDLAIRDDPTFGACMTFACNGRPEATHLLPVDVALVFDSLIAMDGDPTHNEDGDAHRRAAYALERLSSMICGAPRIDALSARMTVHDGAWIFVDVSIGITPRAQRHALSIEPYPFDVEETVDWDGTALTFRPIRPEDEPLHAGLFRAQSAEDLYLRFFSMQREPDHARLARLVRIDYAREMAIIACSGAHTDLVVHGVARAVSEPTGDSAEFAVAIRSDEKGHHLGRMLMNRIIAYCRSRGMAKLVGVVLKDNHRMLALAQDCGFERRVNEDPTIWSVELDLQYTTARRPESLA